MTLYDFLFYSLPFSIYRFENTNLEDCLHHNLVLDFWSRTTAFIEKNCVKTPEFLRRAGTETAINAAHKKIDNGLFDFLKVENCMPIIGPLFKRFLTSLKEPVISSGIAYHMRFIEGKAYMKNGISFF